MNNRHLATLKNGVHPKHPDRPLCESFPSIEGAQRWARLVLRKVDAKAYPGAYVEIEWARVETVRRVTIAEVKAEVQTE